jgi:hypothetical protein
LLDVDGYLHQWEDGFPSSYEANDGKFHDEDIPAAIRSLVDPTGSEGHRLRTFDRSRFGFRNNRDEDNNNDDVENTNRLGELQLPLLRSGTSVKAIEFHRFRAMLIDNFNIAFHNNELCTFDASTAVVVYYQMVHRQNDNNIVSLFLRGFIVAAIFTSGN